MSDKQAPKLITITDITQEVHKVFNLFNTEFFDNSIPLAALTLQSSDKNRSAMGWCSRAPVWGTADGSVQMYEVNISPDFLALPFHETMDTLLHEMIHLYHNVNGIQDVSRKGEYHNKHFRNKALSLGYEYKTNKPHPRHGWTFARIGPELKQKILAMDIDQNLFTLARRGASYYHYIAEGLSPEEAERAAASHQQASNAAKKSKSFKWLCPSCEMTVRSHKEDVNVVCGDCEETLILA